MIIKKCVLTKHSVDSFHRCVVRKLDVTYAILQNAFTCGLFSADGMNFDFGR